MKIEWTREMINFLANTVEESDEISYTNIAKTMSEQFHAEFTKNSLIGKARRLGLPMRTPAVTRKPRQRVHVAAPIPPKILPEKGQTGHHLSAAVRYLQMAARPSERPSALHVLWSTNEGYVRVVREAPPDRLSQVVYLRQCQERPVVTLCMPCRVQTSETGAGGAGGMAVISAT